MRDQRMPIAQPCELEVAERLADPHPDHRAQLVAHLVEQEGLTQRLADMARDLEQPAVLAAEETGTTVPAPQ